MGDFTSKAQLDERSDLRKELQFLKECQFKYFSLAVTITGLIVGIADKFASRLNDDRGVLLAPLLVVLPCWYIFFDKATTITRMVGYLTLLERIIAGDTGYRFLGWENAVHRFRRGEASVPGLRTRLKVYWSGVWNGLQEFSSIRSAHRYWTLCWITFAGLTSASLWLGASSTSTRLFTVSTTIGGTIALLTFLLLLQLVGGNYSYVAAVKKWEHYLSQSDA